jgi:hypothetical protein
MAQIPLGEFAQARAIPRAETRRLDTSAVDQVGRGAAAIGDALQDVGRMAGNMAIQQRAEEKRQADALARAKAANALSAYQLQVQAAVDDVGDQLRRGGDYTKAGTLYDEAMGKIQAPTIDGLPPEALESYNGAIANGRQGGRLKVDGLVVQARRDDGQRQFATALDLAGKTAGQPGANVEAVNQQLRASEQFYIEGFGLDGSVTNKAIQDRIDANWTNQAAQRFNEGHDSIDALQKLLGDVTADDGYYAGKLDADKRNVIAARIGARIDVLQGKAERAADKVDALAEKALAAIDEQVASGVPGTIEQWTAWADVFKGASPERREEFLQRVEDEKETQAFLRLPVDQQLAGLQQRQAELYAAGGDKRERNNFTRLKTAVEANVKLLTETPLQFAQAREGAQIEPINFAALGDPAQAATVTGQLQQRANMVAELRKKYGPQVSNKLLLPQEAAMVVSTLDKLPPTQRVDVFGALRRVAGSQSNYMAVMQQIQPDAPVTAMAGMLHLRNPKAAALVIQGEALLNRTKGDAADDGKFKAVKLPAQAEFDAALSDTLGSAFRDRPEAYAIAMQAVRAGYAGAAAADGDVSGEIDEDRITNIVKAVLGETVDYNGRGDVFVPYGMDPDDFEDKVEATWDALVSRLPPGAPTDLDEYGLQQAGDGRYYVTAGRMFVKDKAGNPLILEVKR